MLPVKALEIFYFDSISTGSVEDRNLTKRIPSCFELFLQEDRVQ